ELRTSRRCASSLSAPLLNQPPDGCTTLAAKARGAHAVFLLPPHLADETPFKETSMAPSLSRRGALIAAAAVLAAGRAHAQSPGNEPNAFAERLAAIEKRAGGRLGFAVSDTGSGRRFAYRGDERFPMCSTFKVLAAAAVLARVDAGKERLDR